MRRFGFLPLLTVIVASIAVTVTARSHHRHSPAARGRSLDRTWTAPKVHAGRKKFNEEDIEVFIPDASKRIILSHLDVEDNLYHGISIQFTCEHHKPVEWVYEGDGAPVVKVETHRYSSPQDLSKSTFGAKVIFTYTNHKQTGWYRCREIHNPSVATSIFAFVPDAITFVSNDKEELYIHDDVAKQRIRLPCVVAKPNASVQLSKEGKLIPISERVTFEPTFGFQIDRDYSSSPYGKYECEDKSTTEKLVVNVLPPKYTLSADVLSGNTENEISTYTENPFGPVKNVFIKFHHDTKRNLLSCCAYSGQGKRINRYPTLKATSCDSVNECAMLKAKLKQTKCRGEDTCDGKQLKKRCTGYFLESQDDAGLIQCSLLGEDEFFMYSKTGDFILTSFDVIPSTEEILEIIPEKGRSPGKTLFTCSANKFFFSIGIRWAIKQPGSHEFKFLEQEHPGKISIEVGPEDAAEVRCFAPIWNSFEWRHVSIKHPLTP